MNNAKKRALSLVLAGVLTVAMPIFSHTGETAFGASSLQDKINAAAKQKKEAQAGIAASKAELDGVLAQVAQLDIEAAEISAELSAIDDVIAETNGKIAEKEVEIAEFEKQIQEKDEAFCARLKTMDESNTANYIDLLLNSDSISDFVSNIETIREITEHDQGIINEMIALKQNVEASKEELVSHRSELEEARGLVQAKQNELNKKIAEKQSYMDSLQNDISKYQQIEQAAEAEEASLRASAAASTSRSQTPTNGNRIKYNGVFCWPAPSYTYVSSEYGYRVHPVYGTTKYHSGLDLAAPGGTNILAAADGVVTLARWNGGYGNCIVVDHGGGLATLYGHCQKLLVSSGQRVSKGQVIGLVGTTGVSTGNHLHFEVHNNGKVTDPWPYLR
ncbi:MAG: hypothetical protein E7418_01000 [Ruminococcaceae bacterium]|nr:hypothetical protein [Oscillospiraceae bacterium]